MISLISALFLFLFFLSDREILYITTMLSSPLRMAGAIIDE